jgi:hypothetical protein
LRQELEASQKQLQAQQERSHLEQIRLEARTQELQAAQAEVQQQVKRLTEALAQETKRREGAEQQAGEIGQRRSELETELAQNQQAQASLRQELEASQKELEGSGRIAFAEQSKLEARPGIGCVKHGVSRGSKPERGGIASTPKARRESRGSGTRKAEVTAQVDTARDLIKAHENVIRSWIRNCGASGEIDRLDTLLKSETGSTPA